MSSNPEIEETNNFLPQPNTQGLVPVITIDHQDKTVLMLGYTNQEAIDKTLETRLAHYYSRSRQKIWQKGEESGHIQKIKNILVDCDQDTLIYVVEQVGHTACHTGRRSCFYREIDLKKYDLKKEVSLKMFPGSIQ